jgi:thioredoxin 1
MPLRVSEASGEIRLTVNNRKKRVVMSKMIESESDLDKVLSECSRIFVLFYASWCPFSQRFLPIFEKHTKNDEKDFCRVLTDEIESCEEDYSIDVVPTVIFFKNGKIAKRLDGVVGEGLNEKQFVEMIDSCRKSKDPT